MFRFGVSFSLAWVAGMAFLGCGDDSSSTQTGASGGAGGTGGSSAGGSSGTGGSSTGGASGAGGAVCADELEPWAGGSAYYAKWTHGPPSDPSYFPIAVWLQSPANAPAYADIGINLYIGLWEGPTESQLDQLAGTMPVMCSQNTAGLDYADVSAIRGWTQQDEPDNAQPDGNGGYGPCVAPAVIQSLYADMVAADDSRPVYLNLGPAVANEAWVGRGDCTGQDEDYPEYIKGADIVSFDIYPVTSTRENVAGNLWYVATGVERLREWANDEKPVWTWIETTHIDNPDVRPTPEQVRSEVWMALISGATGIGYFAHEFEPSFVEAGLLAHDDIREAVREINAEITDLAPVLNTQSVANGVSVSSSVEVKTMVKRYGGDTYLFAVAMRDIETTATFTPTCVPGDASVEVLGEQRTLKMSGGTFSEPFDGYEARLYRIIHGS